MAGARDVAHHQVLRHAIARGGSPPGGFHCRPRHIESRSSRLSGLGGLYSADDFYVLDSHLVVMETTIDNYNRSLPLAESALSREIAGSGGR